MDIGNDQAEIRDLHRDYNKNSDKRGYLMLTPYLLYIKIVVAALLVIILISLGIWIKGAFAERDALRISEKAAKATTEMYAKQWNDNQKLQEGIVNAIKAIRVESNNYISTVETDPEPSVADGSAVVLVAPGVSRPLPSVPAKAGNTPGGAGSPP